MFFHQPSGKACCIKTCNLYSLQHCKIHINSNKSFAVTWKRWSKQTYRETDCSQHLPVIIPQTLSQSRITLEKRRGGGSVRHQVNKGGALLQIDNQTDTSHNQTNKDRKGSPPTAAAASCTWRMKKVKSPSAVKRCQRWRCFWILTALALQSDVIGA